MNGLGFVADATTGAPIPSSMYNVGQVSINEAFSPLLGVDFTLQNNMTAKLEYRQTRVLSLSMTSIQLNEATSKDWVIGLGYKINNFSLFGGGNHRKVKGNTKKPDDKNQQQSKSQRGRNGLNHDLNLRFDLSYRKQAARYATRSSLFVTLVDTSAVLSAIAPMALPAAVPSADTSPAICAAT